LIIANAMKRNSTAYAEYRKLPVDARQWRIELELTLERLPQIFPLRRE
jgi:hypothetical protein